MKDSDLRITQFNYFCTLIDELTKALVAKEGKITVEDVTYMWLKASKTLQDHNINIKQ